jgi:hypothetical protein
MNSRIRIADAAFWVAVVVGPVLASGASKDWLLLLSLPVLVGLLAAYWAREFRPMSPSLLVWLALALALFTVLQAIPLPSFVLARISPQAADLRSFLGGTGPAAVSYEPGETLREALKVLLYGGMAQLAVLHVHRTQSERAVLRPIVWAGLFVVAIGLVHRLLGLDRAFGLWGIARPAHELLSTFVNPNHCAGFMLLAASAALSVAWGERALRSRNAYLVLTGLFVIVGLLAGSMGGTLAFGFAAASVAVVAVASRWPRARCLVPLMLLVAISGWFAATFSKSEWLMDVAGRYDVHVADKLSAVRDSVALVKAHWLMGIGRGAYVSMYPSVQSSPLHLVFQFPENIVMQCLSEWGAIVGGAVLLALFLVPLVCVVSPKERLTRRIAAIGVLSLLLQNLVDFSTELPAVMFAAFVMLGTIVSPSSKDRKPALGARLVLPSFAALGAGLGGWILISPSLWTDLAVLEVAVAEASEAKTLATDMAKWESIYRRHPANPYAAVRMAYLVSRVHPEDRELRLRWVNRSMYLAPMLSDPHLVAASVLMDFGAREQGLSELRRAIALASPSQVALVLAEAVRTARSPAELHALLPRDDVSLDTLQVGPLLRMIAVLRSSDPESIRALLTLVALPDRVDVKSGLSLSSAALSVGANDIALGWLSQLAGAWPEAMEPRVMQAEALFRLGRFEELDVVIDQALANPKVDSSPFLALRARVAIRQRDVSMAREALKRLDHESGFSSEPDASLALLRAEVEVLDRRPGRALTVLRRGLAQEPGDVRMRLMRARVLEGMGRDQEALLDVRAILAETPDDPGARGLERRIAQKPSVGAGGR